MRQTAATFDVVYLQYDVFPYAPFPMESGLFRVNPRVVTDFDDAIHLGYQRHRNAVVRRVLRSKTPMIASSSRHVVVGGAEMADWAARYNKHATIIPTSIDLDRYPVRRVRAGGERRPVIGWIGTPITATYLRGIASALRTLRRRHDFVLRVIGDPGFEMEGIDVEALPWSLEGEVELLYACDIGIMPLPDDEWARGKSALKLIQYFGSSLPAVASPVGANRDVVQHGRNGLLAETSQEWVDQLSRLISSPEDRQRLGMAGRQTAEAKYSLQTNGPKLIEILETVASS